MAYPPDVPAYVPRTATWKPYSQLVRGDGSNSYGGTPPGLLNQLADPNPGMTPGYFTVGGPYGASNGFNPAPINGGTASEAKFRSHANVTHFSRDDPIRNYGEPDASHWHMFFGNRRINAWSTYKTIRTYPHSNAAGGVLNGTGYWVPAFLVNLNNLLYAKVANNISIYYTTSISRALKNELVPIPRGLRYVTGCNMDDPDNTAVKAEIDLANQTYYGGAPRLQYPGTGFNGYKMTIPGSGSYVLTDQGKTHSRWLKNPDGSDPWEGRATAGKVLVEVNAPRYWDGHNLHAPGGYKHFRHGTFNDQSASVSLWPDGWWELPQLQLILEFNHGGFADYGTWRLSSDDMAAAKAGRPFANGESMHADWFGGWEQETFMTWQRNGLGVEGFEPHEMGDSIISSTQKLIVGEQAPDGRPRQVVLSNEYDTLPQYMVRLPTGAGKGPATISHRGL